MEILVGKKPVNTNRLKAIGKGGEADIYALSGDMLLKLFKPPDHPDYENNPSEQQGARDRIATHQTKLRQFPTGLPSRVVTPVELAFDSRGRAIVGYTMRFAKGELIIRLSDKGFRLGNVSNDVVVRAFKDFWQTVNSLHASKVVIGDFNDLNSFFNPSGEVWVIDADSMQFGSYLCKTFTAKFVDPKLCDPKDSSPMLVKPHNTDSDWFAFASILMQSLLFVGPYGGVYKPKTARERIPHSARSLRRITVWDPDVIYPKPAAPYASLPDELLQQFHSMFKKDQRGPFPLQLLEKLSWKTCRKCGLEHSRQSCPICESQIGGLVVEKIVQTVTGKVSSKLILKTGGVILAAAYQNGLKYLVYDNGEYRREDGEIVARAAFDPHLRSRISGSKTLMGKGNQMLVLEKGQIKSRVAVDVSGTIPQFDTNSKHLYFSQGGRLQRDGELDTFSYLGDVLEGQTRFWTGPTFGFGFYWAGRVRVAFVFDPERPGINDTVKLPSMGGQLIDAKCFFASDRCWFFWTSQEQGARKNHCVVVKKDGTVIAHSEALDGEDSWLGNIGAKCAVGEILLSSTDDGIVAIKVENGSAVESRRYPETEPFVDTECSILVGDGGIYVVRRSEITHLKV